MKLLIRNYLESFPPTAALLALRREWAMQRYFKRIGLADLESRFAPTSQASVLSGPFKGMAYVRASSGSVWAPKVLGCYENELHKVVEEVIERAPDILIDLGCAEGYYAVGFGRRLKGCRVIAADLNPLARWRTRRLAKRNGANDNVSIVGRVGKEQLQVMASSGRRTVVWCDIEGGEYDLINPEEVPALCDCMVVIEEHSGMVGRQRIELVNRLNNSHEVEVIEQIQRPLSVPDIPTMQSIFSNEEREVLCSEHRPSWQSWIVARPRLA